MRRWGEAVNTVSSANPAAGVKRCGGQNARATVARAFCPEPSATYPCANLRVLGEATAPRLNVPVISGSSSRNHQVRFSFKDKIRLPGADPWRMLAAMERRWTYLAWLAWRLRVGLGLWFVWSGCQLVFVSGLDRFTRDIANYQMVAAPLDALVAYTLPWVQIVAGIFLMLGLLRRGTLLALCGLVTVFAVAIGWAWAHGLNIACGCHGGNEPIQYWWKVLEFYGYYEALGFLWWMERPRMADSGFTERGLQPALNQQAG